MAVNGVHVPRYAAITVRQNGTNVIVIRNGQTVLDMPWQMAEELAKAILAQARKAEEIEKAESVARDAAILLRAGFPLGLTNNPSIKKLAASKAAWDSDLRRYMPGGIKSKEQFGTPGVYHSKKGRVIVNGC